MELSRALHTPQIVYTTLWRSTMVTTRVQRNRNRETYGPAGDGSGTEGPSETCHGPFLVYDPRSQGVPFTVGTHVCTSKRFDHSYRYIRFWRRAYKNWPRPYSALRPALAKAVSDVNPTSAIDSYFLVLLPFASDTTDATEIEPFLYFFALVGFMLDKQVPSNIDCALMSVAHLKRLTWECRTDALNWLTSENNIGVKGKISVIITSIKLLDWRCAKMNDRIRSLVSPRLCCFVSSTVFVFGILQCIFCG